MSEQGEDTSISSEERRLEAFVERLNQQAAQALRDLNESRVSRGAAPIPAQQRGQTAAGQGEGDPAQENAGGANNPPNLGETEGTGRREGNADNQTGSTGGDFPFEADEDPIGPETTYVAYESEDKPEKPIMGGLTKAGRHWVPWTGGKPNVEWTGLAEDAALSYDSSQQQRVLHNGSDSKNQPEREKGIRPRFRIGDNRQRMLRLLKDHMSTAGLISMTYMRSNEHPDEMVCVLDAPGSTTISQATDHHDVYRHLWDRYDKQNNASAARFLRDSLDPDLEDRLMNRIKPKYQQDFNVIFTELIKSITSSSLDKYARLQEKVRKTTPQKFQGENIQAMADALRIMCKELQDADQFKISLLRTMTDNFFMAGGRTTSGERYRHRILDISDRLRRLIEDKSLKTYERAEPHLLREDLTWMDICSVAEDAYLDELQGNSWHANKHSRDRNTPRMHANHTSTTKEARLLEQHKGGKRQGAKNKATTKRTQPKKDPWITTPPRKGEPQQKLMNDKTFHWCAKCRHWRISHGTAGHIDDFQRKPKNPQLEIDHAAWTCLSAEAHVSEHAWWTAVWEVFTSFDTINILTGSFLALCSMQIAVLGIECGWYVMSTMMWMTTAIVLFALHTSVPRHYQPTSTRTSHATNVWKKKQRKRFKTHQRFYHHPAMPANSLYDSVFGNDDFKHFLHDKRTTIAKFDAPRANHRNKTRRVRRCRGTSQNSCRAKHTPSPARPPNKRNEARPSEHASANVLANAYYTLTAILGCKHAFAAPHKVEEVIPSGGSFDVVWDTGASICVTNDMNDFVGPTSAPTTPTFLNGFLRRTKVKTKGTVEWSILDTHGKPRSLRLPAFYVPGSSVKLISTTSLLHEYKGENNIVEATNIKLSGIPGNEERGSIVAHNRKANRLPTSRAYRTGDLSDVPAALTTTITSVAQHNQNLSQPQKELLKWHYRLGHLSFRRVQFLLRSGALVNTEASRKMQTAAARVQECPLCAACQFGKQHRRPTPGTTQHAIRDRQGVIKTDHLFPGQQVSVDHFVGRTLGRLFTGRGKSDASEMYKGGAMFVDHASGYIHVEPVASLTTHATLEAKTRFESMCRDVGVPVRSYLSDNATTFTSPDYTKHLERFHQVHRFAGVGAHHHNGVAERSIRTIISMARTMMMHQSIHWPTMFDAQHWPMAVVHAAYIHNRVPNAATGLTPMDILSRTRIPLKQLHNLHVWGSPVYVLNKALGDGRKIPRWEPRGERYVNMGLSTRHASTVPLVLSPRTGSITPQFHVVFDDWFATIATNPSDLPDYNTSEWTHMFGDTTYQIPFDDEDIIAMEERDIEREDANDHRRFHSINDAPIPPTSLGAQPAPTRTPTNTDSPAHILEQPSEPEMNNDATPVDQVQPPQPTLQSSDTVHDDTPKSPVPQTEGAEELPERITTTSPNLLPPTEGATNDDESGVMPIASDSPPASPLREPIHASTKRDKAKPTRPPPLRRSERINKREPRERKTVERLTYDKLGGKVVWADEDTLPIEASANVTTQHTGNSSRTQAVQSMKKVLQECCQSLMEFTEHPDDQVTQKAKVLVRNAESMLRNLKTIDTEELQKDERRWAQGDLEMERMLRARQLEIRAEMRREQEEAAADEATSRHEHHILMMSNQSDSSSEDDDSSPGYTMDPIDIGHLWPHHVNITRHIRHYFDHVVQFRFPTEAARSQCIYYAIRRFVDAVDEMLETGEYHLPVSYFGFIPRTQGQRYTLERAIAAMENGLRPPDEDERVQDFMRRAGFAWHLITHDERFEIGILHLHIQLGVAPEVPPTIMAPPSEFEQAEQHVSAPTHHAHHPPQHDDETDEHYAMAAAVEHDDNDNHSAFITYDLLSFFTSGGDLDITDRHFSYKASKADPDTLSFSEAMNDDNKNEWMAAAHKEIHDLTNKGTWIEVPKSSTTDRIFPGTWVFRRKRMPDGTVKKYKGRWCCRGDMMTETEATYAPVVAWSSVRVFLILSILLRWVTTSIDFSNAFVQADIHRPVYLHLPRGFRSTNGPDTCLKLIKSLYGLTIAPKLWYQHLVRALLAEGFRACDQEKCLFMRDGMMIVLYVDDAGIASRTEEEADAFIESMRKRGFDLTREGTFTEFLGISLHRDPKNNTIHLKQTGLINKIIEATSMQHCKPNVTPTTQLALGASTDQPPMKEAWNYRSIVGMLLYLTTNTRPDLAFAVSQVARFSNDPRQPHAKAIKMIVRYLRHTNTMGTIVRPTGQLNLECYVDADFAGLYKRESDDSPNAVRSRTGYVIILGGCPLVWKSKLQTEIALSTMESEYAALSLAMRALIPMQQLINEVNASTSLNQPLQTNIQCTVFEDNEACISLATNHKVTARTKHFLTKWHFFWHWVKEGFIRILHVPTPHQVADIFTKGLARDAFEHLRRMLMGW